MLVGALCWLVGWREFLLVQAPTVLLAGAAGVWLFYVQHQFEDTYWQRTDDWSYADAALRGQLVPEAAEGAPVLHRQHRPAPRAPPERARSPTTTSSARTTRTRSSTTCRRCRFWDGLRAVRLKLWDEERGRLVTFAQARASSGVFSNTSR